MKKVMNKKKMTIEDLALVTERGFKRLENLIEKEVDELAISTAKGFESIDERFDLIDKDIVELKESNENIRENVLNLGDRFVSYNIFDALAKRVNVLEEKK